MKLEDFVPKRKGKKTEKAKYMMLRFDSRPDLQEFIELRVKELGCTKQDYFIGLLCLDRETTRGQKKRA